MVSDALRQALEDAGIDNVDADSIDHDTVINTALQKLNISPAAIVDGTHTSSNVFSASVDTSAPFKGKDISFGDACWDVCVASAKEGSLRMTCGYHR